MAVHQRDVIPMKYPSTPCDFGEISEMKELTPKQQEMLEDLIRLEHYIHLNSQLTAISYQASHIGIKMTKYLQTDTNTFTKKIYKRLNEYKNAQGKYYRRDSSGRIAPFSYSKTHEFDTRFLYPEYPMNIDTKQGFCVTTPHDLVCYGIIHSGCTPSIGNPVALSNDATTQECKLKEGKLLVNQSIRDGSSSSTPIDNTTLFLSFKGSSSIKNFIEDINIRDTSFVKSWKKHGYKDTDFKTDDGFHLSGKELCEILDEIPGTVHKGFLDTLMSGLPDILYFIYLCAIENPMIRKIGFTGHSLGGALSIVMSIAMIVLYEKAKVGMGPFKNVAHIFREPMSVVTFGAPTVMRVSVKAKSAKLANKFKKADKKKNIVELTQWYREKYEICKVVEIINKGKMPDPVSIIPPGFNHAGHTKGSSKHKCSSGVYSNFYEQLKTQSERDDDASKSPLTRFAGYTEEQTKQRKHGSIKANTRGHQFEIQRSGLVQDVIGKFTRHFTDRQMTGGGLFKRNSSGKGKQNPYSINTEGNAFPDSRLFINFFDTTEGYLKAVLRDGSDGDLSSKDNGIFNKVPGHPKYFVNHTKSFIRQMKQLNATPGPCKKMWRYSILGLTPYYAARNKQSKNSLSFPVDNQNGVMSRLGSISTAWNRSKTTLPRLTFYERGTGKKMRKISMIECMKENNSYITDTGTNKVISTKPIYVCSSKETPQLKGGKHTKKRRERKIVRKTKKIE